MSGAWTHTLCWECWIDEYPDTRPAVLFPQRDAEGAVLFPFLAPCCRCGRLTSSGIHVRGAPSEYICGGNHAAYALTWLLTNRMIGTWLEKWVVGMGEVTDAGLDG